MNTYFTSRFSWKTAILVSLGAGLLVACLSIFLQTHGFSVQALSAENPFPITITPARGVASSYDMPEKPVRLRIPSIGVDANVQSVGLSWKGNGEMGIPTNFTDVAWYNEGPRPGMPGSAVIDGHLDGKNVQQAVFYNLDKLKPGDVVEVVDTKGATLQFRVTGSKTYDYNESAPEVFTGDASKARLNLITCAGDWIKTQKLYNKRIVVFTELIPAGNTP